MSISIESCRNDYVGDGATTTFPYDFKIWAPTELNVIVTDTSGNEVELFYPADFDVSGVLKTGGGNVLLTSAPDDGDEITIRRIRPIQQTSSFRNEGQYYGASHEDALDKIIMIDQQQQEELNRSIQLCVHEGSDGFNNVLPQLLGEDSRVIGTNPAGNGFALGPTFTEIENAQAAALSAESAADSADDSATAAADSATDAATSATSAASSASAAAASAAAAVSSGFDTTHSPHAVTDGQSAANLSGETFDGVAFSSVMIFFEVLRGTTIAAVGWMQLNYLNSTWRIEEGPYGGEIHGVTWSVTQSTTVAQLQAALSSGGGGDGSIKFKKLYFAA